MAQYYMPKEIEEFFKKPLKQRAIGEPIQIKEIETPSVTSPNTLLQGIGSLVSSRPQQPSTLTPRTQITSIKTESPRIETKPLTTPSAPITTSISPESLRQVGIGTIIPSQKEQEFLQSQAQKIKTEQDRMKAIETGTIDIDEELKKHGLPSSKELEKRNLNPEYIAKNPTLGKVLTSLGKLHEKQEKWEKETTLGKMEARAAERAAQVAVGKQAELPTTGNKILDFAADMVGTMVGFSTPGGVGQMASGIGSGIATAVSPKVASSVSALASKLPPGIISVGTKALDKLPGIIKTAAPSLHDVIRAIAGGAAYGSTKEAKDFTETIKNSIEEATMFFLSEAIIGGTYRVAKPHMNRAWLRAKGYREVGAPYGYKTGLWQKGYGTDNPQNVFVGEPLTREMADARFRFFLEKGGSKYLTENPKVTEALLGGHLNINLENMKRIAEGKGPLTFESSKKIIPKSFVPVEQQQKILESGPLGKYFKNIKARTQQPGIRQEVKLEMPETIQGIFGDVTPTALTKSMISKDRDVEKEEARDELKKAVAGRLMSLDEAFKVLDAIEDKNLYNKSDVVAVRTVLDEAIPLQMELDKEGEGNEILIDFSELIRYMEGKSPTEPAVSDALKDPTSSIVGKLSNISDKAKTVRGTTVDVRYAIADVDDLITSHDTNLKVNTNYPQDLQPRDRTRVASEIQIEKIAKNIEPSFLGKSPKASEGAPIIGEDMIVESGNARVIALNRAYNYGTADNYKKWLIDNAENFGFNKDEILNINKPVLVRVRTSDVDRVKFVQEANEQSIATMSATEQAMTDAQKLDSGILAQFYPTDDGNILNPQNRDFIGRFLDEVIGPAEKGNYITKDGSISQDGVRRIQNAIFAKAYGDTSSIEKLAESTDSNIKNITNAMLASAPRFVELKEGIQRGNLFDLDITSDIAQAANKLSSLRESGMSIKLYRRQLTMLEDDISDLGKDLLDIFEKYKRSSKKMITILQSYADAVEALGHPSQLGLFGQPEVTKAEILEAVLRRVEGEGEQTSIFQDEAGGSGVRATEAERIPEAERTDITKAGQPEKQVIETEVQDKINNALNKILNKIKTKKDIVEYRILQNRHNGNIVVQSKTTKGDILNATILSGDGNVTTGNYSGDNPTTLQDWTKTSEIVSDKAETVKVDTIVQKDGTKYHISGEGKDIIPRPSAEKTEPEKSAEVAKEPWQMTKEEFTANVPKGYKYIPDLGETIARYNPDGTITLTDAYFGHDEQTKKELLAHEKAHGIMKDVSNSKVFWDLVDSGLFGKYDSEAMRFKGIPYSFKNVEEVLTQLIADLQLDLVPKDFKDKYAVQYNIAQQILDGKKINIEAAIKQAIEESKQKKVTDKTEDARLIQPTGAAGKRLEQPKTKSQDISYHAGDLATGAAKLPIKVSPDDIPIDIAENAYRNVSFDPRGRAHADQRDYVNHMQSLYEELEPLAVTDEQKAILKDELERYKNKYIEMYTKVANARSRTASTMITGPAKFPHKKNQKALDSLQNRLTEFTEWQEKAKESIKKKIDKATPQEALADREYQRLRKELMETFDTLKGIETGEIKWADPALFRSSLKGKLERSYKNGNHEAVRHALVEVKELQKQLKRPIFANNNSIWKLMDEIPEETKPRTGANTIAEYEGVTIQENFDEDRIQIIFDEKPAADVITALRKSGWRWAPSQGAWQRKLTPNANRSARKIISNFYQEKSQEVDHKPEKMQKGELTNIEKDKITFDEHYRAFDKDGYLIYEPSAMLRAKRKEAEGLEDFIEKYNYFKKGEIYILHDATPFTFKGVTRSGDWYFKNLVTGQDEYFKMHMTEGFKAIEETGKTLEDFIGDKAKDREQFLEAPVKIRPKVESKEATPKPDKIVSQREIIDFLSEQLGVPIRIGKYRGPARGIFKRHPEVIRSRLANDLPVISHEIGHFLDKAWDLRSLKTDKNMLKEFEVLAQGVQGPRISEGIAQFVNFYITDPEYAKEVAPLFTEKFEEKLKENPDVRDVLLEARKQYGIWEKQSDLEKVKSMISFDREQKRPYTFERFYTQWVDELQPLKTATDKMLKGSEIPVSRHPFYRAWLNRGWTGIAEAYLHNGQMDKNFNKIGPSLDEILKPIAKHESEDFIAYITAKRAIELHGRGINPGIPEEVAEGSIKDLQGKYPIEKMRQFEQSFEELTEYQDNLLKVLVDSGFLSEGSYDKMKALNRNYAPFYRLMEGFEKPRRIGGKRFADTSQPVKRIKGSGRQIINPLESIIKNTYTFISIAERNTVGRLLTELAESIEGSGQWVEKIDMPVKPTKIQLKEIERTLKEAGVDTKEVDLEQLAVIFRPYTYRSAKDNIVTIFKNGKPVMYQLDPELYIAVKSLDSQSAHWLTDILSVPAQWLRAGATLTPDFPAKNILRDQFTAYVYSKYGYLPVVDAIRGLSHVLKRDDLYWKWYASGGAHGALVSLDRDYMQKNFKKMLTEQTKAQKAKGLLRSPLELLRDISEISEEATRVIEFKKGIEVEGVMVEKEIKSLNDKIDEIEKQLKRVKDNKERKELRNQLRIAYENLKFLKENKEAEVYRRASLAARDMTLDHSRGGHKARDLNRINAFFNVGIQGIDKLAREFRNNPSRTFFRIALLVTLPSLVCYMINRKNPYYEEVARWEKDVFWHIPIPGSKGQRFLRIPKPFEIGVLFGTLPERFLEYVDKNDPKAFKEFENTLEEYVFQGLVPDKEFMFLPTGLIPTAFIPVIESFANKSIFTRTPIVPQSELSLAPSMQYGPDTSEVAKILGGILDVSPRKIDNTIRGYSGGLGRNVTDILDAVLVKTGLAESKIKPGSKDAIDVVSKIPAIGTYISKYPQAYQSPSINDFYDDYNKVEELYRTAKEKKEKEGRKLKITKKEAELIKLRPAMRKTADILSDIRKEQSKILYSNKLTGKEKAQKLHELNMLQLNLVRRIYGKEILK